MSRRVSVYCIWGWVVAFVTLIPTRTMICTQEGHLLYEGGRCSESQPKTGSGYTEWGAPIRANRWTQETGNPNEQVVIKFSVPYAGDFGFWQINCDAIILVIGVDRPTVVFPVTTTYDIAWVEAIFTNWEVWSAKMRILYAINFLSFINHIYWDKCPLLNLLIQNENIQRQAYNCQPLIYWGFQCDMGSWFIKSHFHSSKSGNMFLNSRIFILARTKF